MHRAALPSSVALGLALAACGGEPQPVSPAPVSSSLPPPAPSSPSPKPSAAPPQNTVDTAVTSSAPAPSAPSIPQCALTPEQENLLRAMEQSGRPDLVEKAGDLRIGAEQFVEHLESSRDPEKTARAAKLRAGLCPR